VYCEVVVIVPLLFPKNITFSMYPFADIEDYFCPIKLSMWMMLTMLFFSLNFST
jgi:hypothetical protein